MKRNISVMCFILVVVLFGCAKKEKEQQVRVEVIDGIRHIMNPIIPLKGSVSLELEKKLEINPYEHEDFDLRGFNAVKDKDGEIILFEINDSKAQRFTGDGEYIGSFFRHGQGPGEFVPMRLLYVRFMNDQIWVTGQRKLAKFDKQGKFIDEISIGDTIVLFVDERCYVTEKRTRKEQDTHKQIIIKHIKKTNEIEEGPILMEGTNLGMIRLPRGGFGDGWGTPNIEYAVDRIEKKIYLAMKTEYKIHVKNQEGQTLYVIEKPYIPIKLSNNDKEIMLESFIKRRSDQKQMYLNAYPDELMAIKKMKVLPKGYLAVYRISGLKKYVIDIFDESGKYVYLIESTEDYPLDEADFYDFGFTTVETVDDFPFHVEYRIKNLPEIFSVPSD
jgi:hypothetical protein